MVKQFYYEDTIHYENEVYNKKDSIKCIGWPMSYI